MSTVQAEQNPYPCPCCGFLTFEEPPGSYDLCEVCGWEDDHVQLQFPFTRGGANGKSLYEYQQEILRAFPEPMQEYEARQRDPQWRPLHDQDIKLNQEAPQNGLSYFQSAIRVEPTYYWAR